MLKPDYLCEGLPRGRNEILQLRRRDLQYAAIRLEPKVALVRAHTTLLDNARVLTRLSKGSKELFQHGSFIMINNILPCQPFPSHFRSNYAPNMEFPGKGMLCLLGFLTVFYCR
jgi:hypothetical protein